MLWANCIFVSERDGINLHHARPHHKNTKEEVQITLDRNSFGSANTQIDIKLSTNEPVNNVVTASRRRFAAMLLAGEQKRRHPRWITIDTLNVLTEVLTRQMRRCRRLTVYKIWQVVRRRNISCRPYMAWQAFF
jgi:hypothetical protein